MAEATADAYSSDRFTSWVQCSRLLLQRGATAIEAEAILRSKWMRWAADAWTGKGTPTSRALSDFLKTTNNTDLQNLVNDYEVSDFKYKPDNVYFVKVLSEVVETIRIEADSLEEAEELVRQGEYTNDSVIDKDYNHTEIVEVSKA